MILSDSIEYAKQLIFSLFEIGHNKNLNSNKYSLVFRNYGKFTFEIDLEDLLIYMLNAVPK